jgi:hypothetical protein
MPPKSGSHGDGYNLQFDHLHMGDLEWLAFLVSPSFIMHKRAAHHLGLPA